MTTEPYPIESQLVRHLTRTRFKDLPPGAVRQCKLLIMDSLGVSIPGSRAPGCPEVADLALKWGYAHADKGARILIHGQTPPPPLAALANSTMMHALDFDDTLDASALHTFVTVLPAAMAVSGARDKVSGEEFITALVLGVDLICRLSWAISRPLSWIRTATCGGFGAAAAAGRLLGLDEDAMANALGIVYSQISGNAQGLIEGRLVKRMQPGFAAQAGVTAAYLAQSGITGSRAFLSGEYGFYSLYEQGEYDPEPITRDLGTHWAVTDLSIKPYPACRMTHSAIDAALKLRSGLLDQDGRLDPSTIKSIQITASSMVAQMVGKPFCPGSSPQVDAQFSIPYTVATALLKGKVFLEDFEDQAVCDPKIRALADKVTVTASSDLLPKDLFHARMIITPRDAGIFEAVVDTPLGNPARPMSIDQCKKKFSDCIAFSGLTFDQDWQNQLLDEVENLETLENVNHIQEMMVL